MDYTSLITSEHKKPKFQALVSLLTGAIDANTQLINSMPTLFDLDTATGQQLDRVGEWIGFNRNISPAITSAFFTFDDSALGFDYGIWQDPYSVNGVTVLPDSIYRNLLYAEVASNAWDGSIPKAISLLSIAFPSAAISIQDNQDMSMVICVSGYVDVITQILLSRGYFSVKPCGVSITYLIPSVAGAIFGFDLQNASVAGFDGGSWGVNSLPYTQQPPPDNLGVNFILGSSVLY